MSKPVIWQGQELPPRKPGKVYGLRIYPGGRTQVRQFYARQLVTPMIAASKLMAGEYAQVWLDDVVDTLALWEVRKQDLDE